VQELGIEGSISQQQFDRVVTAVQENGSTRSALRSIERTDIPVARMWRWMQDSGALEQFKR
jgi:hypothetical protein